MQVRNAVCRKKGENTKEGRVTEKKNINVQSNKSRRVSTRILIYIWRSINVYLEIKRPSVCLRIREMRHQGQGRNSNVFIEYGMLDAG